jgi:micrococcal nuclease
MYTYALEITKVYDGDTVNGVVDLGFGIKMAIKIRLADINTPELRTKDLDEKARGYAARDFLREFLDKYKDSLLVRTTKKGKYGRWIGELLIYLPDHEYDSEIVEISEELTSSPMELYLNINDLLVHKGYAERRIY